ncbi:MAG: class I SAM-dependent methyltransferase, partial [Candidatus Cloacimonetes bacterium]|nr:class I SAM-dependent methyltransferase [Candidatus Cloacimonadota bacterium]
MRQFIKTFPLLGPFLCRVYYIWIRPPEAFPGTKEYWEQRYATGGNSGDGSYNRLAEFKAEILNDFESEFKIRSVLEFGCGDGNQLSLSRYPSYVSYDISQTVISHCRAKFQDDNTKSFCLLEDYRNEKAELVLSLDVIFHLVEDPVFEDYMKRLFQAAERFVIIYSSDREDSFQHPGSHVRHRCYSKWIDFNQPGWTRLRHIP